VVNGGSDAEGSASILNSVLLNRNGPYGYPSFTALRFAERSKTLKALRRKNMHHFVSSTGSNGENAIFEVPPVTLRGRPLSINYDNLTTDPAENITIKANFSNEYQYYNLDKHNDQFDLGLSSKITIAEQTLAAISFYEDHGGGFNSNWVLYSENIFPSRRNEFLSHSVNKINYDNLYWRDGTAARLQLGNRFKNSQNITVSQSS
jgi:hypothetical protein